MRPLLIGLVTFSALPMLSAGCSSSPLADGWPEKRPLGSAIETYQPPASLAKREEQKATVALPTADQQVTLGDALAMALMHHPQLAVFGYDVRAAEARALQAGLLPNPELDAEVENFAGSGELTGTDAIETTVSLSQLIELGGDRAARKHVARHNRDLAGWDYEAARLQVLTETAQRYLAALAAKRKLELATQVETLMQQTLAAVDRKVDAGEASELQRTRLSVQVTAARLDREQAQRELATSRQRLSAMWGRPAARFGKLAGELPNVQAIPAMQTLAQALEQNPGLARYASEIALRQAQVKLAKAQGTQDVTVSVGVRHFNENDDTAMVAGVSLPLPLFDRNQHEVLASRFEAARARAQQQATRVQLHTELAERYQLLAASYEQARALRDQMLPAARQAMQQVQAAFDQGEVSLLDVIDAQRTFAASQGRYADALANYHQNLAAVEGLVGQPLNEFDIPATQPATQQE